jgi:hypothetical protein
MNVPLISVGISFPLRTPSTTPLSNPHDKCPSYAGKDVQENHQALAIWLGTFEKGHSLFPSHQKGHIKNDSSHQLPCSEHHLEPNTSWMYPLTQIIYGRNLLPSHVIH